MTRREPPRRSADAYPRERVRPPRTAYETGASRRRPQGHGYEDPRRRPAPRYDEEWWEAPYEEGAYDQEYDRSYEERRSPRRPVPRRDREAYDDEEWLYDSRPARGRPQRPVYTSRTQQQAPPPSKKAQGSKRLFSMVYNLLFYLFTIGLLLSSVLFAFSSKSDASIMGYRFYTVLTNSMVPQEDSPDGGFYAGDLVMIKMASADELETGDIVTFRVGNGDYYLTHRLVDRLDELNGVEGEYIVTKGDANGANDPPVEADRVLGKVLFAIPKVGTVLEFVRENFWLSILCVLSTFGFVLVLKAYLFSSDSPPTATGPSTGPSRPTRRRAY